MILLKQFKFVIYVIHIMYGANLVDDWVDNLVYIGLTFWLIFVCVDLNVDINDDSLPTCDVAKVQRPLSIGLLSNLFDDGDDGDGDGDDDDDDDDDDVFLLGLFRKSEAVLSQHCLCPCKYPEAVRHLEKKRQCCNSSC